MWLRWSVNSVAVNKMKGCRKAYGLRNLRNEILRNGKVKAKVKSS